MIMPYAQVSDTLELGALEKGYFRLRDCPNGNIYLAETTEGQETKHFLVLDDQTIPGEEVTYPEGMTHRSRVDVLNPDSIDMPEIGTWSVER
jgi:hypothetical protein